MNPQLFFDLLNGLRSGNHRGQFILENSCVPQHAVDFEDKYTDKELKKIMYDRYQNSKYECEAVNRRNFTLEILKIGSIGMFLLFLAAMAASRWA